MDISRKTKTFIDSMFLSKIILLDDNASVYKVNVMGIYIMRLNCTAFQFHHGIA